MFTAPPVSDVLTEADLRPATRASLVLVEAISQRAVRATRPAGASSGTFHAIGQPILAEPAADRARLKPRSWDARGFLRRSWVGRLGTARAARRCPPVHGALGPGSVKVTSGPSGRTGR